MFLVFCAIVGLALGDNPLPPGCKGLVATATDPEMKWFCQAPGKRPGTWHKDDDCTNQHVYCPAAQGTTAQPLLAVFLPGTGLTPHGYSEIIVSANSERAF